MTVPLMAAFKNSSDFFLIYRAKTFVKKLLRGKAFIYLHSLYYEAQIKSRGFSSRKQNEENLNNQICSFF